MGGRKLSKETAGVKNKKTRSNQEMSGHAGFQKRNRYSIRTPLRATTERNGGKQDMYPFDFHECKDLIFRNEMQQFCEPVIANSGGIPVFEYRPVNEF